MNAAGDAYPAPRVATGTLNSIAASGAAPVTMQNNTDGRPRTPPASSPGGPPVGTVPLDESVGIAVITPPCDVRRSDDRRPRRSVVTWSRYRFTLLGGVCARRV